jgi:hypothetical protein
MYGMALKVEERIRYVPYTLEAWLYTSISLELSGVWIDVT